MSVLGDTDLAKQDTQHLKFGAKSRRGFNATLSLDVRRIRGALPFAKATLMFA